MFCKLSPWLLHGDRTQWSGCEHAECSFLQDPRHMDKGRGCEEARSICEWVGGSEGVTETSGWSSEQLADCREHRASLLGLAGSRKEEEDAETISVQEIPA